MLPLEGRVVTLCTARFMYFLIDQLMLYSEIIAVCSENFTKHDNTLCGQNVGLLSVEPGGT